MGYYSQLWAFRIRRDWNYPAPALRGLNIGGYISKGWREDLRVFAFGTTGIQSNYVRQAHPLVLPPAVIMRLFVIHRVLSVRTVIRFSFECILGTPNKRLCQAWIASCCVPSHRNAYVIGWNGPDYLLIRPPLGFNELPGYTQCYRIVIVCNKIILVSFCELFHFVSGYEHDEFNIITLKKLVCV